MTASSLNTPCPLTPTETASYYARLADLTRRVVIDRAVSLPVVMSGLQLLAENKFVPPAEFVPNLISGLLIGGQDNQRWECARYGYVGEGFFDDFPAKWPDFKPRVCSLVTLTVAELGYRRGCQWTTAFRAGVRYGFELCPAVAAPVVRHHYLRQPLGEKIIIAMPGIEYRGRADHIFVIEHNATGKHLLVEQAPFYGEREGQTPDRLHLRGDDILMFMRRE